MSEHIYGNDSLEALLVGDTYTKSTGGPINFLSFMSNELLLLHRYELLSVHHHCECSKKSISDKTSE